jgi:hypothetical protein
VGQENNDREREEYLQERRLLIDLKVDSERTLDRTIITLSGGALALSMTFVNQIAPNPKPPLIIDIDNKPEPGVGIVPPNPPVRPPEKPSAPSKPKGK